MNGKLIEGASYFCRISGKQDVNARRVKINVI